MLSLSRRWWKGIGGFVIGLSCCWLLQWGMPGMGERSAIAQTAPLTLSATAAVRQGIEAYQAGKFSEAIAAWQSVLPQLGGEEDRAVVYGNLALAYRQTGQLSEAITTWEKALEIYRDRDESSEIAKILTEQAQAYSDLGQHKRALALLNSSELQNARPDTATQAAIQGIFGNAYSALGRYNDAIAAHQKSLDLAAQANHTSYKATALNNLANAHWKLAERLHYQADLAAREGDPQAPFLEQAERENLDKARQFFEESLEVAQQGAPLEAVWALLNFNRLLESEFHEAIPAENLTLIQKNWERARKLLPGLLDSRDKAYALINLAEGFLRNSDIIRPQEALPVFERALKVARSIGDTKAESFALGSLGELYEKYLGDLTRAMAYTREAQSVAQHMNAADSLYRWQWQAGRILNALGRKEEAIAAYKGAIVSLQSIRGDIIVANKDVQFDFRDRVEPVYRELLALLLESVPATKTALNEQSTASEPSQPSSETQNSSSSLEEVVNILENLKLAEIQNFFGDDCVQVALSEAQGSQSLAETNTAAIYNIVLEERVYTILQAPGQTTKYYSVEVNRSELDEKITQFRYFLEDRTSGRYLPYAREIYDWLIRPMEDDLAAANPTTLLWINDGVLRKIPIAALHDGQEFFIQKYPIAVAPSVSLTISKPLDRSNLDALSVGLTEAKLLEAKEFSPFQQSFAALQNVRTEVNAVREILGGTELLDREFSRDNFEAQVQQQDFPVIHMATHGKFGVDAESTFLLAHDGPIQIDELDNILRSRRSHRPVGLLSLSACQTAAGDNRSALGIAGVAVRAGVESALATLWFINDDATVPLIREFYQQLLDPSITKAEALRRAQTKMIGDLNYRHPAVWSPFILIGNWL
ncbi:MAG: CHAT domain-containing protein [Cyanobacteriota bacterium]|nr:CHAT domain-containing protein [Cyanobacteriota bacterium]